jgi:hypothetical protein
LIKYENHELHPATVVNVARLSHRPDQQIANRPLGAGRAAYHAATDQPSGRWLVMARISAGIGCSHVPAIGAAIDLGKTGEPYWQPLFNGFKATREWMSRNTPDVVILVYNGHATAFSLDLIPTARPFPATAPHLPSR